MIPTCPLCRTDGGDVLWRGAACRVVLADEPDHPGFCRVIWNTHVRETTDLSSGERATLRRVLDAVEAAVRDVVRPDKVNVASLGNLVPHVHWHVIPRFAHDRHFPGSVWSVPRRPAAAVRDTRELRAALQRAVCDRLSSAR